MIRISVIGNAVAQITGLAGTVRDLSAAFSEAVSIAAATEKQLALIQKTSSLSDAAMDSLKERMWALSNASGKTMDDLLDTARLAAATGAATVGAIADMTELAVKAGAAFDMTANDALFQISKIQAGYRSAGYGSVLELEKIMSAVDKLEDSTNTTARSILVAMSRFTGGVIFGMDPVKVAAVTAAILNTGQQAENTGRLLSGVFIDMNKTFKDGSTALEHIAALIGRGGAEVKKAYGMGGDGLLQIFTEMIGKLKSMTDLQERSNFIYSIFGKTGYKVIAPLVVEYEKLAQYTKDALDAAEAGTRLNTAYAIATNNLATEWDKLQRVIENAKADFGEEFLAVLKDITSNLITMVGIAVKDFKNVSGIIVLFKEGLGFINSMLKDAIDWMSMSPKGGVAAVLEAIISGALITKLAAVAGGIAGAIAGFLTPVPGGTVLGLLAGMSAAGGTAGALSVIGINETIKRNTGGAITADEKEQAIANAAMRRIPEIQREMIALAEATKMTVADTERYVAAMQNADVSAMGFFEALKGGVAPLKAFSDALDHKKMVEIGVALELTEKQSRAFAKEILGSDKALERMRDSLAKGTPFYEVYKEVLEHVARKQSQLKKATDGSALSVLDHGKVTDDAAKAQGRLKDATDKTIASLESQKKTTTADKDSFDYFAVLEKINASRGDDYMSKMLNPIKEGFRDATEAGKQLRLEFTMMRDVDRNMEAIAKSTEARQKFNDVITSGRSQADAYRAAVVLLNTQVKTLGETETKTAEAVTKASKAEMSATELLKNKWKKYHDDRRFAMEREKMQTDLQVESMKTYARVTEASLSHAARMAEASAAKIKATFEALGSSTKAVTDMMSTGWADFVKAVKNPFKTGSSSIIEMFKAQSNRQGQLITEQVALAKEQRRMLELQRQMMQSGKGMLFRVQVDGADNAINELLEQLLQKLFMRFMSEGGTLCGISG